MSGATKAISSIFSPKVEKQAKTRMPDPGSFQTKLAARVKRRKEKKARGGRDSTIKTGTSYSNTNLGGTA